MIVRHGETTSHRFLRLTLSGEAVYIMWDRRVGERRRQHQRRLLDERRGERRTSDSPLSLKNLPFIAVEIRAPVRRREGRDYCSSKPFPPP
jgi:hypothetical protein